MTGLTYMAHFSGALCFWRVSPAMGRWLLPACGWRKRDGGLAVAWGLSVLIVVGGLLNLLQWVSKPLLVGLVVGGVAAWVGMGGLGTLITQTRKLRFWEYLMLAAWFWGT